MMRQFMAVLSAVVAVQYACIHSVFGADEPQRAPARESVHEGSDDDEYNFSWLDPDKKVYVLQNRKYRKANRFALFGSVGMNLNSPYRSALVLLPRAAYWFSEQFGVEFFLASVRNSLNSTFRELKDKQNVKPFVRENLNYVGGALTWTPWYSKINMFNKILYFDWFFDAGAGQVQTSYDKNTSATSDPSFVDESVFAFFFGTGLDFFVNRTFLVRLDLVGMTYTAKGADLATSRSYFNYDLTLGIGLAF